MTEGPFGGPRPGATCRIEVVLQLGEKDFDVQNVSEATVATEQKLSEGKQLGDLEFEGPDVIGTTDVPEGGTIVKFEFDEMEIPIERAEEARDIFKSESGLNDIGVVIQCG